jgi:hypothetical protein
MRIKEGTKILPLPNEDLFIHKEKKWRLKLPDSYKKFMESNNGGIPIEQTFACKKRTYAIERFLCMLKTPSENTLGIYDISVVLTQIEERLTENEDLLGAEILPIASLFAGDFVCLDFRGEKDEPSVCVWSHEESGDFTPVLYHVALNFGEFLDLIK